MKTCDLHCHSCFSDGTCTPAELIRLAEKQGLSALALTDHNTTKGLPEFVAAAAQSVVIPVPGCEISTDYQGNELHMVALNIPREAWREYEDFVELMLIAKHHSNLQLIQALQNAGYAIVYDEVAATTDADEFNRAHVAQVMVKKGYVGSVNEAFATVLSEDKGFYVPPKRISALTAVRFIKEYGGVAVLAHPFLSLTYEELTVFLPQAKEAGLDAIETLYSTFDAQQTAQAMELAARFGLKQSGGSDFHGAAKPDIALGTGRGNLCIPLSILESLQNK